MPGVPGVRHGDCAEGDRGVKRGSLTVAGILLSSVRRSLAFSLADSYVGVALQLASTLLISRLLTPTEIGIFAVAAVLAALASTFRDFGVAEYLIQEKNLTDDKIRSAFAANIAVSWLMAGALFASSGAVADFYRQAGIADVMRIQAINFVLIPFGAVTMAYFRRQLNYRPIFIAGLLANITSFIVAVGAALAGLSYMSLAWSGLAGVIVSVAVSIVMRPRDFPAWPALRGMRDVIHFGKHASGIYLLGQVGKNAPEAVIGRALDMAGAAFYSRANGLMEIFNRLFMRSIMQVCLPYFSQAAREQQGTSTVYLRVATLLTGIGWPFMLYVGIVAYSAVRLLYGPQWTESVPLAQILCVAAILELPYLLASEVMMAEGRVDQSSRLQIPLQGLRLLGLLLVFPFGLTGLCYGLVAAALGGAIVSHRFLHRIIGLRFPAMISACLPSVLVTIISVTPVALAAIAVGQNEENFVVFFAAGSVATPIAWLAALRVLRHPFWLEVCKLFGQARVLLRAGR